MEMEMAEFQDFVNECNLVTKEVHFALMTNPSPNPSPNP